MIRSYYYDDKPNNKPAKKTFLRRAYDDSQNDSYHDENFSEEFGQTKKFWNHDGGNIMHGGDDDDRNFQEHHYRQEDEEKGENLLILPVNNTKSSITNMRTGILIRVKSTFVIVSIPISTMARMAARATILITTGILILITEEGIAIINILGILTTIMVGQSIIMMVILTTTIVMITGVLILRRKEMRKVTSRKVLQRPHRSSFVS